MSAISAIKNRPKHGFQTRSGPNRNGSNGDHVMAKKPLPSPEVLRQLLRYEPETGKLFWRERAPEWFDGGDQTDVQRAASWNKRFSGKEAFTTVAAGGYRMGTVLYEKLYAHRVIWAMVGGCWPRDQIDHINGNKLDNRFENFRDVTPSDNGKNKRLRSDNISGHHGVHWDNVNQKWVSIVMNGRVRRHLGRFSELSQAVASRKRAEADCGYHDNHGKD